MRARRVPQVLQQPLQKLAALKPAGGLRVAHVWAKVPVCPQYGAGAGLFQPRLPRCGPYVGRQRQPCCGFALTCWLIRSLCSGVPGVSLGMGLSLSCLALLLLNLWGLSTALLPRLTLTGLACVCVVCLRLACMNICWLHAGAIARERLRRLLRRGKGIVAIGHEQAGEPSALPQRADRVYERKSHEHSSQATSALL